MTPTESSTPIDEALLAALLAEEVALAEGNSPLEDPSGSRHGLRECLRLLRTLGPEAEAGSAPGGATESLKFGRFTILGEVGRGGFGIVYRARDPLLGRDVALKVPRPELIASADVRRRFLLEARAAGGLDHPNIVPVLDAGPLGPFCYIASTYCPGPTLAQWLKGRSDPVPPKLAARLIAELADAVQHAHERSVLHRDIKPSNIILAVGRPETTPPSAEGVLTPRLTDFGLAKLAEEGGGETQTMALIGSPPYMAPEQAAGRNAELGPATDVHALGAVLYETLVGLPPFAGESRAETLRRVIESEPIAPRTLRPRLPRDLETIALTCLAKVPARRYGSAAALRDDLGRFLRGEPIRARPPGWARRLWTGFRRRPTLAASTLLAALGIAAFIGVLIWSNARQRHAIVQLTAERNRANEHEREAARHRDLAERHFHGSQLQLAGQRLDEGQFERSQDILHELEPAPDEVDRRGFAWHALWRRACPGVEPMYGHDRNVNAIEITPDGRTLVSGDLGGTIRLWDLSSGRPLAVLDGHSRPLSRFAITADGRFLASSASTIEDPRPEVLLWDLPARRIVARPKLPEGSWVSSMGFEPKDDSLWVQVHASGPSPSCEILRYDPGAETPRRRGEGRWQSSHQVNVLPDGRVVEVVPDEGSDSDRWSFPVAESGRVEWVMYGVSVMQVRFAASSDSRLVAAASPGVAILCRDSRTGAEVDRHATPDASACEMAFSPDGRTLAAGLDSGVISLRDLSTGRALRLTVSDPPRPKPVFSLAFSPDGSKLAASEWAIPGGATPVTIWDVPTGRRIAEYPGRRDRVAQIRFTPDGRSLLIVSGPTLRRWRPEHGPEPPSPSGHADEAWATAFRADGRVLATGSDDDEPHTIKLWNPENGELQRQWSGGPGTVASLAFSPDGGLLASGHLRPSENVRLWDPETGRLLAMLSGHTDRVRAVAFHPGGELLASAGSDRTIRIWEVVTRRCRRELAGHASTVQSLGFSPDGCTLVSASSDATVRLWDVASGHLLSTLGGPAKFTAVAFAPDGGTIAAADEGGILTLWDPATGERRRGIHSEDGVMRAVAFTPDGQALAAAGEAGTVELWDAVAGQRLLTLPGKRQLIHSLAFSPDGRILAACDHGGTVRLWRGP